ncbi:hypothetical protein L6R52_16470 [Myxococcota bacterium]|nr:hypothetical protein [Myxococcota bacterium]
MITPIVTLTLALASAGPGTSPGTNTSKNVDASPKRAAELWEPFAVFTMPSPKTSLPRVRALAELVEHPKTIAKDVESLGFDPFDPKALELIGLDPAAPAYAFAVDPEGPLVVELAVAKPKLVDEALSRAITKRKGARALPDGVAKRGAGFYVGVVERPRLAVQRRGNKLFVQLGNGRSGIGAADELLAIDVAQSAKQRPKTAPRLGGTNGATPDAWLVADGTQGIDRVEGLAWMSEGKLELRGRAWLDLAAGLVLGDLASNAGPARRLVPDVPADQRAAELLVRVGRAGIADLLELNKLGPEKARALTGEAHVVLTAGGSVLAAIAIDPKATDAEVKVLRDALAKLDHDAPPKLVTRGAERLLTFFLGAEDRGALEAVVAKLEQSSAPKSALASPTAPIELVLHPRLFLDGLEDRARAKNGPSLSRSRVAGARLALGDTSKRIERIRVELSLPAGFAEGSVSIEYGAAR